MALYNVGLPCTTAGKDSHARHVAYFSRGHRYCKITAWHILQIKLLFFRHFSLFHVQTAVIKIIEIALTKNLKTPISPKWHVCFELARLPFITSLYMIVCQELRTSKHELFTILILFEESKATNLSRDNRKQKRSNTLT